MVLENPLRFKSIGESSEQWIFLSNNKGTSVYFGSIFPYSIYWMF